MKRLLIILFAALMLPLSAFATIWVASGNGDSNLYEVDQQTGATVRIVGDTGQYFTGLAYDRNRGVLIGTTSPNSADPSSVYEIDPATGIATRLGAHGVDSAIIDLTFSNDGVLWGWAEPGEDRLVTINLDTGVATAVGVGQGSSGRTLEFTNSGKIAVFNLSLATLFDPVSGNLTGETIALNGSGSINASFRTSTGLAYAVKAEGPTGPRTLVTVNFDTGVVTELGPISVLNASAIASNLFDPVLNPDDPRSSSRAITAVPTLSEWAIIFLVALIGFGTIFSMRKRSA